jgi:hypothetical protein
MILHVLWLPSRSSVAEATVASFGLTARHASRGLRLDRGGEFLRDFHRKGGREEEGLMVNLTVLNRIVDETVS